jgi:hypothetical protein
MTKTKDPEMRTETVVVTPELACDWLALNTNNRPLRESWVQALARRIEADEWVLNGESIKFNCTGNLIDGQHRLAAVAMANKSITTQVTYGAPANAFETLDGQKRRTLSDALALMGETGCANLAGCINLHWRYEHRQMVGAVTLPTTHAGLTHFATHPGLREAAKVGDRHSTKARCTPTVLGVAWYLFSAKDPDSASEFMAALSEGTELKATDPIFRLRERFIRNREARLKMGSAELLALVIKAWNYWRIGREVEVLQWRFRGGELYPEPA